MSEGYVPNPTVVAIQVAAPEPLTIDSLNGFTPAGQPAALNPTFVFTNPDGTAGGTLLTSLEVAVTQENRMIILANAPGSLLSTLEVFTSKSVLVTPATPNGNSLSWPVGTLFVKQQSNGASAVTVVVPSEPPQGVPALSRFLGLYTFPVPTKDSSGRWTTKMQPNTALYSCSSGQDTVVATQDNPYPLVTLIAGIPNNGSYTYDGTYGTTLDVIQVCSFMGVKAYYVSAASVVGTV
jgi:hypothetical protein